jgi:hypothetical protein
MIDLTAIPEDELIARGQYSIVREKHEDAKKRLALLCGQFGTIAPQVLRLAQPADNAPVEVVAIHGLLAQGRDLLAKIETLADDIDGLAIQRAAIKREVWGD